MVLVVVLDLYEHLRQGGRHQTPTRILSLTVTFRQFYLLQVDGLLKTWGNLGSLFTTSFVSSTTGWVDDPLLRLVSHARFLCRGFVQIYASSQHCHARAVMPGLPGICKLLVSFGGVSKADDLLGIRGSSRSRCS